MKKLDKKAIWLFYFSTLLGLIFIALPIGIIMSSILAEISWNEIQDMPQIPWYFVFLLHYWWIVLLLLAVIGYVWAYLSWYFYRYELREDGFRKEQGVIAKRYVTIPYERIQNVDIHRSLLARILGLSDLQIQTAGMSAVVSSRAVAGLGAEGRLPGIERMEAEKIRDELIKRARGKHTSGI